MRVISTFALGAVYFIALFPLIFSEDLYKILGVRRGASTQEIKAAYKKLAREWHPDKNKDPDATDRFTKINEAYETLTDSERRRDYDNFGYTSAQERPQPRQHDFGFPFGDMFGGGFSFGGGRQATSVIDKHMTTLRNFETKLQPGSQHTPCFIYAFGNFCFTCMRMDHLLEKFFEEMENVGLCVAAVHVHRSPDLANHLRVTSIPELMGLVNGRVIYMKWDTLALQDLRDFVRHLFPKETLPMLKDGKVDAFLENWQNNLVSAIFFSPRTEPSARFLAPAFYHRDRIAFSYVSTSTNDALKLMEKFNINKRRETLLMFNEDASSPVATISMQQLPRSTVEEVISANRFLSLPRLSSQSVFEELCPKEPKLKKRKLCVALVTKKVPEHDVHRERFRKFAHSVASQLAPDRVRFVYLYEEVQQRVMQALTKGNMTRTDTVLEVAILWHLDDGRVSYEFLEQGWNLQEDGLVVSREALTKRLTELLTSDHLLPYKAMVPDFYNEHALQAVETDILYIEAVFCRYHPTTWVMTMMGIVMVCAMGIFMKKMADMEEKQVQARMKAKERQTRPPSSTPDNQTIHLYELRYETFINLVKNADTGLTIVVLVDEESKPHILRKFAEIMQPYSRYSALTFGFMQLEYYVSWYQHLLEMSMSFKVKLDSINIRNCIGTVLALNGYRKYYYIYHPRRAQKWIRAQNKIVQAMGFMDSDSDSEPQNQAAADNDDKLFLNEVLSGLSLWMDRVFDGSVRKIRLNEWPEMAP
ncbi:hypothetical protein C0Q70_03886 [Pomacea canaliculata]|uniref:DnaJ homolog subfamily C member 16 n=1 Tax=Pomacea canaliculata TaxID=400727 RepID=A0A2T7PTZ6_POMCA|nr:hypothetical protein C0Q70_03886 [Pomacea canaliculata]